MKRMALVSFVTAVIGAAAVTAAFAADRGAALYERHCAACHGASGDGQGPAAYLLLPKPRVFTLGVYKFRETPSGSLPTDADLLRTLQRGIPGTAMPAWNRLPETDLAAVVAHIKSFSPVFGEEEPEPPIPIGTPPRATPTTVEAGRTIYELMKCADCHGPEGRGDGPSAETLKDDQDRSIRPYDFTRGSSSLKGGASPADIYRTFMTGLDGTPMPSYGDSLSEEEAWQLVHYVQSLSATPGSDAVPSGTPALTAIALDGEAPLDPDDEVWKSVPETLVPLRPLWARDRRVDTVWVQAARSRDSVTFRFRWRDSQQDLGLARHEDFRDALAIQFAPERDSDDYVGLPFIGMGDGDGAVTVWHWQADREADIAADGLRDVEDAYAAMHVDQQVGDLRNDAAFLTGFAAGNPISAREFSTPVGVLAAKGLGTLTPLPAEAQTVEGRGVWRNGEWTVALRRSASSDFPPDLGDGRAATVAVAVWDGAAGDRDGQKVISEWMELALEAKVTAP